MVVATLCAEEEAFLGMVEVKYQQQDESFFFVTLAVFLCILPLLVIVMQVYIKTQL